MSSCEAECFAIAAAVVEVDYLRGLLGEINEVIDHPHVPGDPTIVHVDNQSAIYDAYNRTGRRTRAINIRFHRVRQAINERVISIQKVRGGNSVDSEQLADVFTKSANRRLFTALRSRFMG